MFFSRRQIVTLKASRALVSPRSAYLSPTLQITQRLDSTQVRNPVEPSCFVQDDGLADLLVDTPTVDVQDRAVMRHGRVCRYGGVEVEDARWALHRLFDLCIAPLAVVTDHLRDALPVHDDKALFFHIDFFSGTLLGLKNHLIARRAKSRV